MTLKGLKYYLCNPDRWYAFFATRGLLNWMSDETYLKFAFRVRCGSTLDLENPKTYNEKLQWLKLHDRKPEYTTMVDKYEVKQYIAEKIGDEYVIPTLGVWDRFEDIDFDSLPEQFVLKCTHDSGGLVICKDKAKLDIADARKRITKSLKKNYYWANREWPYKNVQPRIIAEKFMVDDSGGLQDYKVLCFNGEPKLIQVHKGRFQSHTQDYYDTQWKRQAIYQGDPMSSTETAKPVFLEQMLEVSRKLSAGIPHVRVDWYYVDGQLYFGELTFFDGSGLVPFEPEHWDYILGSWIDLTL